MGQLDGVGRIFQTDLSHRVGRDLQVDRTEHDRKRGDKDENGDDGPHDTVEIHEEEVADSAPRPDAAKPTDAPETDPKPESSDSEGDGLDISA